MEKFWKALKYSDETLDNFMILVTAMLVEVASVQCPVYLVCVSEDWLEAAET